MHRLEAGNSGITKISPTTRSIKNLVDIDCLRETVYNALGHYDWLNGGVPSVYVYSDRVDIISYGGLPFGQTKENFFKGISKPRSDWFIRVLRVLGFAERTGYGIPQIISKYGKEAFEITDSFILVTLPYDMEVMSSLDGDEHLNEHLNEHLETNGNDREKVVIQLIKANPYITYDEVSSKLDISIATTRRIFSSLKKKGILVGYRTNRYDKWKLKD